MELVLVIARLWKRRIAVGIGLLLAAACAIALGPAPSSSSAVAWSRVMVDTKDSQLVVAAPEGGETISWRSETLTHFMTTDEVVAKIARRAGIPATSLKVVEPELSTPILRTSLAFSAGQAADSGGPPYVLSVECDVVLSLISFSAAAPTAPEARRLAEAAVVELESASNDGGSYSSPIPTGDSPELEPLTVAEVSPVRVETITKPGGYLRNAVLAAVLFLAWCGGVALAPELVRSVLGALRDPGSDRPAAAGPPAA